MARRKSICLAQFLKTTPQFLLLGTVTTYSWKGALGLTSRRDRLCGFSAFERGGILMLGDGVHAVLPLGLWRQDGYISEAKEWYCRVTFGC